MEKCLVYWMICVSFCGLLAGCRDQTPPPENVSGEAAPLFPAAYMIEKENHFDFQSGPECAAYASAYLLRHYGVEASGPELYQDFPGKLSEGGVFPQGIVSFFTEREYSAEFIQDGSVESLKQEVSKGAPVIVFIHGKYPYTSVHDTHYVPVVGYDETYFYFAESVENLANCQSEETPAYNRKTEISDFENLWKNIDGAWDYPYFSISPPA